MFKLSNEAACYSITQYVIRLPVQIWPTYENFMNMMNVDKC